MLMQERTHYFHFNELGGLEMLKAQDLTLEFSRHVHEGFCIGVIDDGAQRFFRSGANHVAPRGDIILVNADEVHTGSSALDSAWSYRAIYPTPEMFQELTQDLTMYQGSVPWFSQAVIHDVGLSQQLRFLFNVLEQPEQHSLFKETLYLSTLACLVSRYGQSRSSQVALSDHPCGVARVQHLMADQPEQDYSLQELAQAAGLSQWHFLRQFKKYVGMTPHLWLVQHRILKAKRLLRAGEPLVNIAMQCGFADQSHFTRHFKKALGVTPQNYRQQLILN